jgi:hypothetical protein
MPASIAGEGTKENGTVKTYLGDGCYAEFDGYAITLTTENGVRTTNTIVLEPSVYEALTKFVGQLRAVSASTETP